MKTREDPCLARWPRHLGLFLGLLLLGAVAVQFELLAPVDTLLYDRLVQTRPVEEVDEVVLVDIDQRSLSALGRWPWPRDRHAELVERLTRAGAAAVGLDIGFVEPDQAHPEHDLALIDAVARNGKVVLPVSVEFCNADGKLEEILPMPLLAEGAAALGHVEVEMDADGVVRALYLKGGLHLPRWPAFGLAVAQVGGRWPPDRPLPGQKAPQQGPSEAWQRDHRVLVPFGAQRFSRWSFVDVLNDQVPADAFDGRLVLVGATAAGLGSRFAVAGPHQGRPLASTELHAALLGSLLHDQLITEASPLTRHLMVLLVLVLALVLLLLAGRRIALWAPLLLLAPLLLAWGLLAYADYWLAPTVPMVLVLLLFIATTLWQLRRSGKALSTQRQLLHATLSSVGDAILQLDERQRVVELNPQAVDLLGEDESRLLGRRLGDLVRLARREKNRLQPFPLDQILEKDELVAETLVLLDDDGERPVNLAITPIPGGKGTMVVLADLSREQELAAALARQQHYNELTGLPNRELLMERLRRMLRRAQNQRRQVMVVEFAIDRFATINRLHGRQGGDQVLRRIGKRLRAFRGPGIEVGYLGGDTFLVLIEGEAADERLESLRKALGEPITLADGEILNPVVTLGASLYPENLGEAETLLAQASIALQQAKEHRRGEVVLFHQDMESRQRRTQVVTELLQRAAKEHLVETHYQPIVSLRTRKVVGVECLMRLRDGEGGYVPSEEFLPLAERLGLILELGHQQLYEACVLLERWRRSGLGDLRLCYNLSARQLAAPDLVENIDNLLRITGFPAERLEFEVGAGLVQGIDDHGSAVLERLTDLGVRLAIDDFAAGAVQLSHLERHPFRRLKLDRSFTWGLEEQPGTRAVTQALVGMAHNLGMKVVAKGVETDGQLGQLLAAGCDEAQGFHLGQPMSAGAFGAYLQRSREGVSLDR